MGLQGNRKWVSWRRVVSASVSAPAVPMAAAEMRVDDAGDIHEDALSVVGVCTEVYEYYVRPARHDNDLGEAPSLFTPKTLAGEGYELTSTGVDHHYLFHGYEYDCPTKADEIQTSNTRVIVYPVSDVETAALKRAEAAEELKAYHRTHGGSLAAAAAAARADN